MSETATMGTPAAAYNLASIALAALAALVPEQDLSPEAMFLRAYAFPAEDLDDYLANPSGSDLPLLRLSDDLRLSSIEVLAIALAAAVETNAMCGRAVAHLQAPLGGSRPTLGLFAAALSSLGIEAEDVFQTVLAGPALQSGALNLASEQAPAGERPLSVPMSVWMGLNGRDCAWPGTSIGLGSLPPIPLSIAIEEEAIAQAAALSRTNGALTVRTGSAAEGRAIVCRVAEELGSRPLFIEDGAQLPGIAAVLHLRSLLPVFCFDLAPGERKLLPGLPFYNGALMVLCGAEGTAEVRGRALYNWRVGVPDIEERRQLWIQVLDDGSLADRLAMDHRYSMGRIAHLARLANYHSVLRGGDTLDSVDFASAAWSVEEGGLESLAEPLRETIPDEALVRTPGLHAELEQLFLRCRFREQLSHGLGVSTVTRYRPGVRALFVGPSGTGKTLAAGWLATRLGLPIYRVDLAGITSKYIGETERNLAQLLARAEGAEIILLFDEADSLFAKRTDVREANDRFANAQTNYLLQRIETFDGIVVLTSNSRARFDSAFARRLDAIIDFSPPGPEERRALWHAHLGSGHSLTTQQVNQLAAAADVCGGNIRNIVLAAAIPACAESRNIEYRDILQGLASEYRKLSRNVPAQFEVFG